MICIGQNVLSNVILAKCPYCKAGITLTTLPKYYCQWCSERIPNFKYLVLFRDERENYHFNRRIFNVTV